MILHNNLMNLQIQESSPTRDYKVGFRDARHLAAEKAIQFDSIMEEMADKMETIIDHFAPIAGDCDDPLQAQLEEHDLSEARDVLSRYTNLVKSGG